MIAHEEWEAEGRRLFGDDRMQWQFVCPACGHVARVRDWQAAGAPATAIAFSCVGRWSEGAKPAFSRSGPCTYAGGGLIGVNPVEVTWPNGRAQRFFDFARSEDRAAPGGGR